SKRDWSAAVCSSDLLGQSRLPCTVATDETDTVSLVHTEGHIGHEGPGTDVDFEAGGLNHSVSKLRPMRSARNCWGWMLRARARADRKRGEEGDWVRA